MKKVLKKTARFLVELYKKIQKNQVFLTANQLTFKITLAFFPFLIFLMALLAYFDLDVNDFLGKMPKSLPDQLKDLIEIFNKEVLSSRRPEILSFSLIFSIYSTSTGFVSIIKSINRSYNQRDNRNFLVVRAISIGFVFLFALSIIFSLFSMVYVDYILAFFKRYILISNSVINLVSFVISFGVMFLTIICIFKFSNSRHAKLKSLVPGALFTLISWLAATEIYSFYVKNYANVSVIYGSIGNLFVLLIWMNIISTLLLIGNEINIIVSKRS